MANYAPHNKDNKKFTMHIKHQNTPYQRIVITKENSTNTEPAIIEYKPLSPMPTPDAAAFYTYANQDLERPDSDRSLTPTGAPLVIDWDPKLDLKPEAPEDGELPLSPDSGNYTIEDDTEVWERDTIYLNSPRRHHSGSWKDFTMDPSRPSDAKLAALGPPKYKKKRYIEHIYSYLEQIEGDYSD